jgi:hypothetical protein
MHTYTKQYGLQEFFSCYCKNLKTRKEKKGMEIKGHQSQIGSPTMTHTALKERSRQNNANNAK